MKKVTFNYNGKSITFFLDKENSVMVNATEMAKVFEKQVNEFLSNDGTKKFIAVCLNNRNSGFSGVEKTGNPVLLEIKSEEDLYISRQKSGTLMHQILAIKFAAWLDPFFEVWIYSTIQKLLFGKYAEREQSFKRTVALQQEQNNLINNVNENGMGQLRRYWEINEELRHERKIRRLLTVESLSGMANLFENQE